MKLFFLLLLVSSFCWAMDLPITSSIRGGEIFSECNQITDQKIIKAMYLAQQEHFLKPKVRTSHDKFIYDQLKTDFGYHFEPEKYPNTEGMAHPIPSKFKAGGVYLHLHPNSNSPIIAILMTQHLTPYWQKCNEFKSFAVWGDEENHRFIGIIASLTGKFYGSVLEDYMSYTGIYWKLPAGAFEEWCGDVKKQPCEHEPRQDPNEITIRGIVYRGDEVWYQMPFQVDGAYPWVKNKLLKKDRPNKEIEDGKAFGDLVGKKIGFLTYPDYFESVDGNTVYLINHDLKKNFKDKKIKPLVEGRDPWWSFRVSRVDDEYIYLNILYQLLWEEGKEVVEVLDKMPHFEMKVKRSLVTRPNGSLRIYDSTKHQMHKFPVQIKFTGWHDFHPGENFVPAKLTPLEALMPFINKLDSNERKEKRINYLKDIIWN